MHWGRTRGHVREKQRSPDSPAPRSSACGVRRPPAPRPTLPFCTPPAPHTPGESSTQQVIPPTCSQVLLCPQGRPSPTARLFPASALMPRPKRLLLQIQGEPRIPSIQNAAESSAHTEYLLPKRPLPPPPPVSPLHCGLLEGDPPHSPASPRLECWLVHGPRQTQRCGTDTPGAVPDSTLSPVWGHNGSRLLPANTAADLNSN